MTIHQSKGLEFKYVFVVGLSEGIFPSHRSIRDRKKAAEEEERRLMYVALTRAERALFLTESEGFCSATHSNKYPSRFLNEIKESLIKVEGDMDPTLLKGTKSLVELLEREINPPVSENVFSAGEEVEHKVLGKGTIISIDAEKCFCYVEFGDKKINLKCSVLSKIGNVMEKKNDDEEMSDDNGKVEKKNNCYEATIKIWEELSKSFLGCQ
jgi:DNA helicase-2/ATP-dependent DNA helicase PcrA